jgi:opacity protein-like surface antigen
MNKKKYLITLLSIMTISVFFQMDSHAQRFGGAAVVGLNASQIEGDLLAGYNKLGLTGGVKLEYALEKPWFISLELLYSQRGSQSELVPNSSIPIRKINLQYIELPIMAIYKDWWIEGDDYFKVNAEAGLSYGFLFDSSVSEGSFTVGTDDLQTNDLAILIGANYFVNKHWAFGVRYNRSLTKLYKNPDTDERDLFGYFLSFRTMYQF